MKNSPSVSQLGVIIVHFVRRYHVIIFTLTVVIGVSVAVFLLNGLIALSGEGGPTQSPVTTFDQATIDRINSFNPADYKGTDSFSLPDGRINPLVE